MKFFGATCILTVKLSLLACFSFMGMETQASSKFVPCHEKVIEATDTHKSACDLCADAEDAWSSDCGTIQTNSDISEITEDPIKIVTEYWFLDEIKTSSTDTINVYRPPPIVLWKSVQPKTKTIVLVL